MIRANNSTTILLSIIVIMLFIGLGVTIYYVLDLDWFSKPQIGIYNENVSNKQDINEIKIEKRVEYDITKRTYNLLLNTNEIRVVVYKDGTVGLTMLENNKYSNLQNYTELLGKEVKPSLNGIIRAYEVQVSKNETEMRFVVLLDSAGNLYELVEKELINNGKYAFIKIEGLAKIIDIRQITNDGVIENTTEINAIAIDEQSNELLITDYLIKNNE